MDRGGGAEFGLIAKNRRCSASEPPNLKTHSSVAMCTLPLNMPAFPNEGEHRVKNAHVVEEDTSADFIVVVHVI